MKIAYFDATAGISGDMTLAALIDAGASWETLCKAIDSLRLPGCSLRKEETHRGGFRGLKAHVEVDSHPADSTESSPREHSHNHEHPHGHEGHHDKPHGHGHSHESEARPHAHVHRNLRDIIAIIGGSTLSPRAKKIATSIFQRLGEAEARVHGKPIDDVHFHEVGAVDSIVDIVGTAVCLDSLGVDRVFASAVAVGSGTIRIAHGTVGVPAPATAELLRRIPIAPSNVVGEQATPTGAAILATLAEGFGPAPSMRVETIGVGAGSKDWPSCANLLRVYVGEATEAIGAPATVKTTRETVCLLETNLDDVSGEWVGRCMDELLRRGALDAYSTPIMMKKNRPGVMLTAICRPADADSLEEIIFRETTSLGVRRQLIARSVLPRESRTVETVFGPIEGKVAFLNEAVRFSPEHESCRAAADRCGVPLRDVYEAALRAFAPSR